MFLGRLSKGRNILKRGPLLRVRYRLEYLALRAFAAIIPRLSRRSVLATARALGSIAFRLDRRGRNLGRQNLNTAIQHGGLDLGGRDHDDVLEICYQNFARGFLDLFWFTRLNRETLDRWVKMENEAQVRELLGAGRGAVFLTPHYGIFEWTSLIVGLHGIPLDIVAQDFKNPLVERVFSRARQCSGHRVVSRQGAMLKLLRTARNGGSVAMLPDLNLKPQGAAALADVFGVSAWLTSAHVEISRRCDIPMVLAVCEPHPDGRAVLRVLDVIHAGRENSHLSRQELTQRVWDRIETAVRDCPEHWLWMYRHWRFRQSDDTEQPIEPIASLKLYDASGPEGSLTAKIGDRSQAATRTARAA
jgi:KDO2-lipid IV(A) lauroyltransferase